jgi:hypothetical protein
MYAMFFNSTFNQPLVQWNVANVQTMAQMLSYSQMSMDNYDSTLIGWNSTFTNAGVTGLTVGADTLRYCAGAAARANLVSRGFTFTGDTLDCPGLEITLSDVNEDTHQISFLNSGNETVTVQEQPGILDHCTPTTVPVDETFTCTYYPSTLVFNVTVEGNTSHMTFTLPVNLTGPPTPPPPPLAEIQHTVPGIYHDVVPDGMCAAVVTAAGAGGGNAGAGAGGPGAVLNVTFTSLVVNQSLNSVVGAKGLNQGPGSRAGGGGLTSLTIGGVLALVSGGGGGGGGNNGSLGPVGGVGSGGNGGIVITNWICTQGQGGAATLPGTAGLAGTGMTGGVGGVGSSPLNYGGNGGDGICGGGGGGGGSSSPGRPGTGALGAAGGEPGQTQTGASGGGGGGGGTSYLSPQFSTTRATGVVAPNVTDGSITINYIPCNQTLDISPPTLTVPPVIGQPGDVLTVDYTVASGAILTVTYNPYGFIFQLVNGQIRVTIPPGLVPGTYFPRIALNLETGEITLAAIQISDSVIYLTIPVIVVVGTCTAESQARCAEQTTLNSLWVYNPATCTCDCNVAQLYVQCPMLAATCRPVPAACACQA